jgi:hypothetical protein
MTLSQPIDNRSDARPSCCLLAGNADACPAAIDLQPFTTSILAPAAKFATSPPTPYQTTAPNCPALPLRPDILHLSAVVKSP